MGMAASQVRLLQLTQRSNDVRRKLTELDADKMSLTRDMDKITLKYQQAINTKTLKMTNNGGVDYIDLTYENMMYPGYANNDQLYMVTDKSGKVVVNDFYKKYAERISPDGISGDWESNRAEILSELTGRSADDIANAENYYFEYLDSKETLAKIEDKEPDKSSFEMNSNHSTTDLLSRIGNCCGISDWKSAYYDDTKTISSSDIKSVMESIKSRLSKYFMEDSDKFEAACDSTGKWGTPNDTVTVKELIEFFVGNYKAQGGRFAGGTSADPNTGAKNIVWYDVDSSAYQTYLTKYNTWKASKDEAEEKMKTALSFYNQLFTADVQSKIDFYDKLFSSIAENGWTYNERISEPNYLNNMFQNGIYTITTAERNRVEKNHTYSYENTYNTDIAINCKNIAQISDKDARQDALVKYEKEKQIINMKESRIDTRMKNLETENAAIKQMIDSVKQVISNNMEHTFNIPSA